MSIIGKDVESNVEVELTERARLEGTYVLGKSGMGKSTLLSRMILADIENGVPLLVLDPHGGLVEDVLKRYPGNGVPALLDATDPDWVFGINLFEADNPNDTSEVARRAGVVMESFKKVWGVGDDRSWGPRLENVLRNASLTLLSTPGATLSDIYLLLLDADYRKQVVNNGRVTSAKMFWQRYDALNRTERSNWIEPVLNKIDAILTNPTLGKIFSSRTTTIPPLVGVETVLVNLDVGPLTEEGSALLGSFLVQRALSETLERSVYDTACAVYADEYWRFATPAFPMLINEARKRRVMTTVAHQNRAQLDYSERMTILGASNLIVFQVEGSDAEEMANQFKHVETGPGEYIRDQVVRAVSPRPVEDLLREGHEKDAVRRFTTTYLSIFDRNRRAPRDDNGWIAFGGHINLDPFNLEEGIREIDELFLAYGEKRTSIFQFDGIARIPAICHYLKPIIAELPDRVGASTYRWEKPMIAALYDFTTKFVLGEFKSNDPQVIKQREILLKAVRAETERLAGWSARFDIDPEFVTRRLTNFIGQLLITGFYLEEYPVMTTTGSTVPEFRPRSVQVLSDVFANELVGLPRYQAMVKLDAGAVQARVVTLPHEREDTAGIFYSRHRAQYLWCQPVEDEPIALVAEVLADEWERT